MNEQPAQENNRKFVNKLRKECRIETLVKKWPGIEQNVWFKPKWCDLTENPQSNTTVNASITGVKFAVSGTEEKEVSMITVANYLGLEEITSKKNSTLLMIEDQDCCTEGKSNSLLTIIQ